MDLEPDYLRCGERVGLRAPLPEDEQEFFALRRASEDFHGPWEPTPQAGVDVYSSAEFANFLEGHGEAARRYRFLVCRLEDHRIVGLVNLGEIVRGCFQSAYMGYWVGVEFARQGYLSEGVSLVVAHAFEVMGLHRIEANVRPENEASIALVRSLGFELEGYSPRYLKIAGEWCDHERWTILADAEV